jgi:hypothetical protein
MSGTNSSAVIAANSRVKGCTTTASTPSEPSFAILAGRSRIIRVGLSGLKSTLGCGENVRTTETPPLCGPTGPRSR